MSLVKHIKDIKCNPKLSWELMISTRIFRNIERRFKYLAQEQMQQIPLCFPYFEYDFTKYFGRNFFTILAIGVYRGLHFDAKKIESYGLIIHLIRGVVTATDNMLDDEEKGTVRIVDAQGLILPNVLMLLMHQSLLEQEIALLSNTMEQHRHVSRYLLDGLSNIATVEMEEEVGINYVLEPEAVIEKIHAYRGASLLELIFLIPASFESDPEGKLQKAREGMRQIGLSGQMLDDVLDLAQDIEEHNHNYLQSCIIYEKLDGEIEKLDLDNLSKLDNFTPEDFFPDSTGKVINRALHVAIDGFMLFEQAGFPINKKDAILLIKKLFELRGVEHLWYLAKIDEVN